MSSVAPLAALDPTVRRITSQQASKQAFLERTDSRAGNLEIRRSPVNLSI